MIELSRNRGATRHQMRLSTYEDWKHCITVECRLSLNPEFITERLDALKDPGDHHTQKFVQEWGQAHLNQVIQWFESAQAEF